MELISADLLVEEPPCTYLPRFNLNYRVEGSRSIKVRNISEFFYPPHHPLGIFHTRMGPRMLHLERPGPHSRLHRPNTATPQVDPGSYSHGSAHTRNGPARPTRITTPQRPGPHCSASLGPAPPQPDAHGTHKPEPGYALSTSCPWTWVVHAFYRSHPAQATARSRSGSRIQTPGGTRVDAVYKATPRDVPSHAAARTSLIW